MELRPKGELTVLEEYSKLHDRFEEAENSDELKRDYAVFINLCTFDLPIL